MGKKQPLTPTRRIAIWPCRDTVSGNVTFTVLGPFMGWDKDARKLTLSELIELRDAANAQIQQARKGME